MSSCVETTIAYEYGLGLDRDFSLPQVASQAKARNFKDRSDNMTRSCHAAQDNGVESVKRRKTGFVEKTAVVETISPGMIFMA